MFSNAYHGPIQMIMNTITILTLLYTIAESQLHKCGPIKNNLKISRLIKTTLECPRYNILPIGELVKSHARDKVKNGFKIF